MEHEQRAILAREARDGLPVVDDLSASADRRRDLDAFDRTLRPAERPASLVEKAAHQDATSPWQDRGVVAKLIDALVDTPDGGADERVCLAAPAGEGRGEWHELIGERANDLLQRVRIAGTGRADEGIRQRLCACHRHGHAAKTPPRREVVRKRAPPTRLKRMAPR